ncbi:MAG TPA: cytochrome c3 family protein, partial [Rubricoccaceae bacterium]
MHAQLLSPGPLTRTHASLEGLRNCTQCHALGRRGIDPAKCLTCHTPIRDRIRRREGLHANVARDCATCHTDHEGRAFDPAPVSARGFDHTRTGFTLAGQHRSVACRSCHTPARITDAGVRQTLGAAGRLAETFLGVGETCETCHRSESPHTSALAGQSCQTCHAPSGWNDTRAFSHRQTGFALTGAHVRTSCTGCHGAEGRGAARFRNVPDDCASCHRDESPHGRQFAGQTCASCHETSRWSTASQGFNHQQTGFPLAGAHASVSCASCHGSGPTARFAGTPEACASCHADESPHGNQFAGQGCQTCHAPTRWEATPGFSHARTGFPLVGQHVEASCASCHAGGARAVFASAETACASCHEDAHDGALGADCQTCHAPTGWARMAASFDADRFDHQAHTGFALVGAHAGATCTACHGDGSPGGRTVRDDAGFHITATGSGDGATFPAVRATECRSCHTDAHAGTLSAEADCQTCHTQDAFAPATFGLARHQTET